MAPQPWTPHAFFTICVPLDPQRWLLVCLSTDTSGARLAEQQCPQVLVQ
jgi:hypothetical protein